MDQEAALKKAAARATRSTTLQAPWLPKSVLARQKHGSRNLCWQNQKQHHKAMKGTFRHYGSRPKAAAADLGGYTFEQAAAAEAKENTSRPKAAAAAQAAEATPVPGTPPSVTVPGTPPLVETAALQQRPLHFGPVFEVATVPLASLKLSFLPVPKPDRRVDDCSNCHLLRCLWVWGPGSGDQSMGVYIYIHVS